MFISLIFEQAAGEQAHIPFDTGWDVHVNVCIRTE